ncbi:hypothetical protein BD779DRAFT_1545599, partial [Infundibulicybe gibba]
MISHSFPLPSFPILTLLHPIHRFQIALLMLAFYLLAPSSSKIILYLHCFDRSYYLCSASHPRLFLAISAPLRLVEGCSWSGYLCVVLRVSSAAIWI